MSERWREVMGAALVWNSPIGRLTIETDKRGGFFLDNGGVRWVLKAESFDAAKTEAERIIADRCRETLRLLGE